MVHLPLHTLEVDWRSCDATQAEAIPQGDPLCFRGMRPATPPPRVVSYPQSAAPEDGPRLADSPMARRRRVYRVWSPDRQRARLPEVLLRPVPATVLPPRRRDPTVLHLRRLRRRVPHGRGGRETASATPQLARHPMPPLPSRPPQARRLGGVARRPRRD